MLFRKEYIFETRSTRFRRYTKNIFFIFVFLFFLYIGTGIYIYKSSEQAIASSKNGLFNRTPHLVVVFTGAKGRIPLGVKLAKEYGQTRILITGVNARNNIQTLLTPLEFSENIDINQVEIDYLARNTVENVLATKLYLSQNREVKKLLIVSHDYHLPRIQRIISSLMNDESLEFFYIGVKSDFTNIRSAKILLKEIYKYIRTNLFLMIWEDDNQTIVSPY